MGCGSSKQGREQVPVDTNSFFPPPPDSAAPSSAAEIRTLSNQQPPLHQPPAAPTEASIASAPPSSPKRIRVSPPSSPGKGSRSPRSPSRKKKTPYVPPQPIDGTPFSPQLKTEQSHPKATTTTSSSVSNGSAPAVATAAQIAVDSASFHSSPVASSSPSAGNRQKKKKVRGKADGKIASENNIPGGGGFDEDGSLDAGEELFGGEGAAPPFNLSVVADDDLIDPADLIGSDEEDRLHDDIDSSVSKHSDTGGGGFFMNNNNNNHQLQQSHPETLPGESVSMSAARRSLLTITPQPSSESGMRFDELYRLKGVLGTGAFSTVREGFHRSNAELSYAVKCINRKKLSEEDEAALLDEVAILKEMRHMHIIRLYDFFVEPSTYYLVMERMRGGELFDRVVAKAYYNEKEARDTCKILLEAVGYCHTHHVAHRDLKPENLLLLSEEDDSTVKIADFGFAKKVYEQNCLTTQCGTPGYVAPEILEGTPYDERADMWSVGVILYILLGGYPPFIESTQRDLFRKIRKGEYEFHEEYWGTVSGEAKHLISSLLTVEPDNRLTAAGALGDGWITGDDAKLAKNDLGANLKKLQNFNGKRKLRAAVSVIMAMNKLNTLSTALSSS